MKRWDRLLAVLLTTLMFTGTWTSIAEMKHEIEGEQGIKDIELEIESIDNESVISEALESDDSLELEGFDLTDLNSELTVSSEESLHGADITSIQVNNSDNDFDIDDNGVLVKYNGQNSSVDIPGSVTRIGDNAFKECYTLTSVTIPDSVTSIGDSAFKSCTNLTSVTISNSVTIIEDEAFWNCENLNSIDIPGTVNSIGVYAFSKCYNLASVTLHEGTTSINYGAFWGCKNLHAITIPYGVSIINKWTFSFCYSLSSVSLPSTLSKIEGEAFYDCSNLTSITILSKNPVIYSDAFKGCPNQMTFYTLVDSDISYWSIPRDSTLIDNLFLLNENSSYQLDYKNKIQIVIESVNVKSYRSSNTKVATVSKDGLVTAKSMGKAKITVSLSNGRKRVLTINVPDPAKLSASKLTISNIDVLKLKLTGRLNRKVTWTSSDDNIIKISQSNNDSAKIKAIKNGTAIIKAKITNGKTLTCKIKVVNPLTIKEYYNDELSSWEVGLKYTNYSNKTIKYVEFYILQYNNRGDKLKGSDDLYHYNDDILPHDCTYSYAEVNSDTRKVKFRIKEITFSDKTIWRP